MPDPDVRPSRPQGNELLEGLLGNEIILETMTFGFALHEMIYDSAGKPADYRFLAVNSAFERLTGLGRDQLVGKRVLEVMPATESRWIETYGAVTLTGEPVSVRDYARSLDRHYEVWAWRPAPGRFAVLVQDMTNRVKNELSLAESEKRLSEARNRLDSALEATGAGLWDWDVAAGVATVDSRWAEMLGLGSQGRSVDEEEWKSLCHPEDHEPAERLFRRHLAGESPGYECELRLRKADGGWLWVLDRGRISARDGAGKPLRVTGTQVDITRRKTAELEERREHGILSGLLNSIQDIVLWKDRSGAFVGCNPAVCGFFGIPESGILGKTDADLFPARVAEINRAEDLRVLETGQALRSESWMERLRGERRYIERIKSPLRTRDGEILGVVVAARDITERRSAEAIVAARYQVLEYAQGHTSEEIMRKALDVAEALTGSSVGFFLSLDEGQAEYRLQAWSTRTLEKYCRMESTDRHFPLPEAGVWSECVREKRPVIHNDYPALKGRKEFPAGHLPLARELIAPVLREDRVVGIFAVGNKESDYDSIDVLSVSQLADQLWEVAQNRVGEERLRKALEEKEALLQELFHRTKNSMQLINAMIELKKYELGDEASLRTFEDIQNKILAMALVQEKIYLSGDLSAIDLGEYLRELAGLLEDGAPVRPEGVALRVNAASVKVSVDSAIPCGILVSELLGNSLNHAFPAGLKGSIDLEVGGNEGGELWIEERDDGVGLPPGFDPRRSPKLGLQTVVGIGEEQLHGLVSFGKPGPGFSCRVTFKDQYRRVKFS